jgi:hypothetical protein
VVDTYDDLLYNQIHLTEVEFTHKKGLDPWNVVLAVVLAALPTFFVFLLYKGIWLRELKCLELNNV